jgi:RND family efflux transporter MFP subunit
MVRRSLVWLIPGLALACGGAVARPAERPAGPEPAAARVRRGDFAGRLLLTGELVAAAGDDLVVPRTPSWRVQIRWMAADGAVVSAGQPVLEFDNTAFAGDLEEQRLKAVEAAQTLDRRRAELAAEKSEKAFAVERRQVELEKAKIAAAVPPEIVSKRDYEERQLDLRKAEVELAKARVDLAAQQRAAAAELADLALKLAKQRREISRAEEAIARLSIRAPRAGVVVVADHPFEGRKIAAGDTLFAGQTVMRLPDLATLEVAARLSDVDDGRLAVGTPVVCTVDAYPGDPFPGRVAEISPIAREEPGDSLRRFFAVRVVPRDLDAEHLLPGMSVKVEARTDERHGVLLVPRQAVDWSAEAPRVRLAGGGEAAVELGPCNPFDCVVEGGLEEGARVVAEAGG